MSLFAVSVPDCTGSSLKLEACFLESVLSSPPGWRRHCLSLPSLDDFYAPFSPSSISQELFSCCAWFGGKGNRNRGRLGTSSELFVALLIRQNLGTDSVLKARPSPLQSFPLVHFTGRSGTDFGEFRHRQHRHPRCGRVSRCSQRIHHFCNRVIPGLELAFAVRSAPTWTWTALRHVLDGAECWPSLVSPFLATGNLS